MAKQNAVAHVHEEIMDLARGGMLKTKAHLAMGMLGGLTASKWWFIHCVNVFFCMSSSASEFACLNRRAHSSMLGPAQSSSPSFCSDWLMSLFRPPMLLNIWNNWLADSNRNETRNRECILWVFYREKAGMDKYDASSCWFFEF